MDRADADEDRHVLRRSTRAVAAVGLAGALLVAGTPAWAIEGSGGSQPSTPVVTPGSEGGTLSVTVTQTDSSPGGGTVTRVPVTRSVPPLCWYERGKTGYEYYEYWKPGGEARESGTLDSYQAQGLLNPGWEEHGTDTTGYWYEARCQYDAPTGTYMEYRATHPPVFVPEGQPAPPQDASVDPEVLAQIASESMVLPEGTIRWNPSLVGSGATLVNTDTWVWVEDVATTVSVRATIPSGTWAQVDATLSGLKVTAPGSTGATCPDTGTPWTSGATSTSCSLRFDRSTANQPVKSGQSLPTATMTARATWTASWTSSVDQATRNPIDVDAVETSAEVPVAEIQSIVTGS